MQLKKLVRGIAVSAVAIAAAIGVADSAEFASAAGTKVVHSAPHAGVPLADDNPGPLVPPH